MSDVAGARKTFVASQIASLEPLAFVVVGVLEPPFDALQVRREADGSLAVEVLPRGDGEPFSAEQKARLAALGFPQAVGGEGDGESLTSMNVPADAEVAAALVERVLAEIWEVDDASAIDVRHGSDRLAHEAEKKLTEMRDFIEPVLAEMAGGPAKQDDDEDYLLDLGRVRIFVAPRALPERPPIIRVFAITNAGLKVTPELGLFLSRLNFSLMFCRFSVDTDNQSVWLDETLLGDQVTAEELRFTVQMVAATANEWDKKIAATFGGRVREDPPPEPPPSASAPPSRNKPGEGGYL